MSSSETRLDSRAFCTNLRNTQEEEFSADGRVLIRTSGTEPLIRVMIEGKDMERMEKAAKELAAFIEKTLQ